MRPPSNCRRPTERVHPARWLLALAILLTTLLPTARADGPAPAEGVTKVTLVFSGGHETDPRDHGRPVVLVAAALGVPPAVFRDAFSRVHPAPAGEQPDPAQVRLNKQALLQRLSPYGVTNDRLDEVSNYYRYRRETGDLWRHTDAAGYALVKGGRIVSVVLTQRGAGYTTPPAVTAPGAGLSVYPTAVLAFGTDLTTNGSVAKIMVAPLGDFGPPNNPAGRISEVQVQSGSQATSPRPHSN